MNDLTILCQPNIIKPLHSLNPRTILGKSWWDKERQAAQEKYNYCCAACGVHKSKADIFQWLEGHESYEINFDEYSYKLIEILPLCHACHNYIHSGRLLMLLRKQEITQDRYNFIMNRGNQLLVEAGINKEEFLYNLFEGNFIKGFPEKNGTWNKWHLIIDNKKYFSKFKTFEDWREYYKN